jgi:hypothetical protein
LSRADDFDFP